MHWLLALADHNLVTILLEDLATIFSIGVTIRLGEHLAVVRFMVTFVIDLSFLDNANVDIGS